MVEQTVLSLRPGVRLTERGGETGLELDGAFQPVRNARQELLLRVLAERGRTTESLLELLGGPGDGYEAALELAALILTFERYLVS